MERNLAIFMPVAFDDSAEPPASFVLLRWGRTDYTKNGKPGAIEFCEADADAIIAEFSGRGRDLVVDYDHQTLSGGKAPAAGWISALSKGAEGLVAEVSWTPAGRGHLSRREYRYHSPVLAFGAGCHPRSLHSVALTNHPAFHGYPSLVADDLPDPSGNNPQEKKHMNEHLKKLAEAIGLPVAFDDADKLADEKAAQAIREKVEAERKAVADFLALHDCKTLDDVTGKVKGMVPASEKAELEGRLNAIEADKAVEKAFADRKLVEAQREWAVAYAKADLKAFADFVAKAPVVTPLNDAPFKKKGDGGKDGCDFDDEELAIMSKLGLSPEDFKKKDTKKEE